MDGSHIRKEQVADSKISGYVWTGPYITRCKRQLQFHDVKFDQRGNILPSRRPRFASDEQDKRDGKGKKNSSQQLFTSKSNCDSRYSLRNSDFKMPRFNTIKYGKHSIRTMALSSGRNLHEKN